MLSPEGTIKIGLDYDGVVIKKASPWDIPRRASKWGLPTLPGAREGIDYLRSQPDVRVLGVYTVRPEWLREGQTARQVLRRQIPVEKITHTPNSSEGKIEALFANSLDLPYLPPGLTEVSFQMRLEMIGVEQIVLIDDSVEKVVKAAKELHRRKVELRPLLERFTLAAFNPGQPERLKGLIIPGVVHVVEMRDWADVEKMVDQVRFHASLQKK